MAIMSSLNQHLIRERRKKDVPSSQSMECRAEHDNRNDGWLEVLIMLSICEAELEDVCGDEHEEHQTWKQL